MAKRSSRRQLNQHEVEILNLLLAQFKQLGLGTESLNDGYKGYSRDELKNLCCVDSIMSEVDFDLSFRDLESEGLINSGHKEHVKNDPSSVLMFIGFFTSTYEFVFLTEAGYKLVSQAKDKRNTPNQHFHLSGHFHQSQIGFGSVVEQKLTVEVDAGDTFEKLRQAIRVAVDDAIKMENAQLHVTALENASDQSTRFRKYNDLVASLANHTTVLTPFLTFLLHYISTSH